jgi:hypothetical protein
MSDVLVPIANGTKAVIAKLLIGCDQAYLFVYGLADKAVKRLGVRLFDNLANDITLTADSSDDGRFPAQASAMLFLIPVAILVLAADASLIDFDDAHKLLETVILHTSTKPMADIPSGMQRRPFAKEHAPKLARRDSLFALQNRVENLEPSHERNVGILENGPNQNREAIRILVRVGLIPAIPMERPRRAFINLGVIATRTVRPIRPAAHSQIGPTSGFIGKRRHKFLEGLHAQNIAHSQSVVKYRNIHPS